MRIESVGSSGRRAVAGLAAALVLAFAAFPIEAAAQQGGCVIPSQVPEGVYEAFYETVGDDFFGLNDEKVCDSITSAMLSTCHKGVSAAAKCFQQVFKGVLKGYKSACSTEGDEKSACSAFFSDEVSGIQAQVSASADLGHAVCEADAEEFWSFCMFGFF